jgi:CubicO group peptidase (beta-lactamase class C family)
VARKGSDRITVNDRFNIDSNSKAMPATVVEMLVQEGTLTWDVKPVEFLEISGVKDTRAPKITLKQLLNHHAALPPFSNDGETFWKAWPK